MEIPKRIVTGLGVGSFIYLVILLFSNDKVVTVNTIILTFFISISAGIASFIFDREKLSFLTCLVIHYLVVNVTVIIGSYLLISIESFPNLLASIFLIYLLSYMTVYLKMRITSKEVNQLVRIIQKEHKEK